MRRGRVAFLAGAGISHSPPSNLPLAGDLISAILGNLRHESRFLAGLFPSEQKFLRLFANPTRHELRFEALLQVLLDTMGDLSILDYLRKGSANGNHRLLALSCQHKCPVITTNFDELIEGAMSGRGGVRIVACEEDIGPFLRESLARRPLLFKIHGTISRPATLKATLKQVGASGMAFMWERRKGQLFEKIMRQRHLIVLGYSGLDDFDIVAKLDIIDSTKEVLWVLHDAESSYAKPASPALVKRLCKDKTLRNLLLDERVSVIRAETGLIAARLVKEAFGNKINPPTITRNERRRIIEDVNRSVLKLIKRWIRDNPGLPEFLIGRLLYIVGHRKKVLQVLKPAEATFRESNDMIQLGRVLVNRAVTLDDLGRRSQAGRVAEQAVTCAQIAGDAQALCFAIVNLGVLKMGNRDFHAARDTLVRGAKLAKTLGSHSQYAHASANLGALLWTIAEYDESKKWLKRAYRTYRKLGDLSGCATTLGTVAKIVYVQDGNAESAELIFRMSLRVAEALKDLDMQAKLWNNIAGLLRRQGKLGPSQQAYERGLSLARQMSNRQSQLVAKIGLASLALCRGNIARAIELGEACLDEAQSLGLRDHAAQLAGNLGLSLLDSCAYPESLTYFQRALPEFEDLGLINEAAFTHRNIAECLLKMGNRTEAQIHVRTAKELYENIGLVAEAADAAKLLHQ